MTRRDIKGRRKSAKANATRRRPIEEKLLNKFERYRRNKVVDLSAIKRGKQLAADLQTTVASDEMLSELHPAHGMYVMAQNQLSIMAEQLTALNEPDRLTRILEQMEELHTPSGPPMSPLTRSFFTCWSLFDLGVGLGRETFTTLAIAIAQRYGTSQELLRLMNVLQDSRMGIYQHEGLDGSSIVLRELITDSVCRCQCPTGYFGEEGQLWYVRLLPPPAEQFTDYVIFTTPYLLLSPNHYGWLEYFDRCLPGDDGTDQRVKAYELHMKYGPSYDFWLEFVFEAYVNFQPDVVFLQGLPDVEESRPCSPINLGKRPDELLEISLNPLK